MADKHAPTRALAAYDHALVCQRRADLPLDALPSRIGAATMAARAEVVVRHGSRTLAVERVQPHGSLRRLTCEPTALDRCRACYGTGLATTSGARRAPWTLCPALAAAALRPTGTIFALTGGRRPRPLRPLAAVSWCSALLCAGRLVRCQGLGGLLPLTLRGRDAWSL